MDAANLLHQGFAGEARGYVRVLRESLASDTLSAETMQAIIGQFKILALGAQALGSVEIAGPASQAETILDGIIGEGRAISPDDIRMLNAHLDEIDAFLGPETDTKAAARSVPDTSLVTDDLLSIFAQEAQEYSETIQAGLGVIQSNPGSEGAMRDVRRATHTLKGAAASVGIEPVAQMAHFMEELLEAFIETNTVLTQGAVDMLVEAGDMLDSLIAADADHTAVEQLAQLLDRYQDLPRPEIDIFMPVEQLTDQPGNELTAEHDLASPREMESTLKVPLRRVDSLLNQVGEVAIGHSALNDHLKGFQSLLIELDYSSRRLHRLARDIETQIEVVAQGQDDVIDTHDAGFDPLEMDRYTSLYQLTRGLEEVAADTNNVNRSLHDLTRVFDASLTRERRLTAEIQEHLMTTRLVPFQSIEARLRRVARQTARDLHKTVNFQVSGQSVLIDKTVLDALNEALIHLIRNSIDHGVESPEKRKAAGKPAAGTLSLSVRRDRRRTIVRLSDDGAGIDTSRIRQRAISLGIIDTSQEASDDRLIDLLFEEDFSLAEKVTHTSGRGIGLNIVRRTMRQLQGTVRVESTAGQGTTFILSLPLSLAVARTLMIQSSGETYGVLIEQIAHVLRLSSANMEDIQKQGVMRHGDRVYRIFNLSEFVEPGSASITDQHYGLMLDLDESATMVLVDGVMGIHETVIKPLSAHVRQMRGLSGATISGRGQVVLILDMIDIAVGETTSIDRHTAAPPRMLTTGETGLSIMVVDDSLSVRRAVCMVLERQGWHTATAKDGIEALEKLLSIRPDVVLLDIEMPRMNGFELLARIRADEKLRSLPVIFLTSRASAKHRSHAESLGCNGYIVKPFRNEELIDEVRRATVAMPL